MVTIYLQIGAISKSIDFARLPVLHARHTDLVIQRIAKSIAGETTNTRNTRQLSKAHESRFIVMGRDTDNVREVVSGSSVSEGGGMIWTESYSQASYLEGNDDAPALDVYQSLSNGSCEICGRQWNMFDRGRLGKKRANGPER